MDWNVWQRMVGWRNGRCGSIFAVVVGTMGKSVKYVVVTMLAACCAGSVLAHGQEQESVAREARMQGREAVVSGVLIQTRDTVSGSFHSQVSDAVAKGVRQLERDTVASLVAEYEADIRALMDRGGLVAGRAVGGACIGGWSDR